MFGTARNGANAYAKVDMETGVTSASPHKLIVMLFDGALVSVSTALQHMKAGNIAAKGQSISKAISIIDSGLRASLDQKAGGSIAISLDQLYEYMSSRLIIANLKNQPEILQEVHGLLEELKGAWVAIDTNQAGAPAMVQPPPSRVAAYDPLAPRVSNLFKA